MNKTIRTLSHTQSDTVIRVDVEVYSGLLILTVDGVNTVFYVLKPKLLDVIVSDLMTFTCEAQIMIFLTTLEAMDALAVA